MAGIFLRISSYFCGFFLKFCLVFGFMAGAELIEPGYHMENGQANIKKTKKKKQRR